MGHKQCARGIDYCFACATRLALPPPIPTPSSFPTQCKPHLKLRWYFGSRRRFEGGAELITHRHQKLLQIRSWDWTLCWGGPSSAMFPLTLSLWGAEVSLFARVTNNKILRCTSTINSWAKYESKVCVVVLGISISLSLSLFLWLAGNTQIIGNRTLGWWWLPHTLRAKIDQCAAKWKLEFFLFFFLFLSKNANANTPLALSVMLYGDLPYATDIYIYKKLQREVFEKYSLINCC